MLKYSCMEEVLQVTPVVGLPQSTGWSQVVEHRLDGNRHISICLSVEGDNAGNIGREMIDHVVQQPPKSAQGLFQTSEELVAKANHLECQVSFGLAFYRRLRVTLVSYRSSILLRRDSKLGSILKTDNELGLVEGKFQVDDVFIFVTRQAEQFLSEIKINYGKGYDTEGVITALVPSLHGLEDSSRSSLAFVSVLPAPVVEDRSVTGEISIAVETDNDSASIISVETTGQKSEELNSNLDSMANKETSSNQEVEDSPTLNTEEQHKPHKSGGSFRKLGAFLVGILVSVWQGLTKIPSQISKLFSSKTYVGKGTSKQRRNRLIVGAVVLLIISVLVGYFFVRSRYRQEQTAAVITPFQTEIAQIEKMAVSDPVLARQEMSNLIEQIKTRKLAAQESGNNWMERQLDAVLATANQAHESISGIDEVSELPIFFDLRMADSSFISAVTERMDDKLVAVDSGQKKIVALDLDSKNFMINELTEIAEVKALATDLTQDDPTALLLADGIYDLELTGDARPAEIIAEGDSNREAILIGSFATYIYVFNPERRNIYRYAQGSSGYSDPIGWLTDPLGIPFDQVKDWAIDGDIWITSNQGEVKRFQSGSELDFQIAGMENPLTGSLQVVTDESMENLYLMEPAQSRVVILSKNGDFLREVSNQSIGAATDFVVNADETTAYLVSGSTIFELEL